MQGIVLENTLKISKKKEHILFLKRDKKRRIH